MNITPELLEKMIAFIDAMRIKENEVAGGSFNLNTVALFLRLARKDSQDLTQEQIAEDMNVVRSTLTKLFRVLSKGKGDRVKGLGLIEHKYNMFDDARRKTPVITKEGEEFLNELATLFKEGNKNGT